MERTKLGPVEKFFDDSGVWQLGQRVLNSRGWTVRPRDDYEIVLFRLHDTGDIVLVEASRLEPNVPNPPLPAETESWHDMMDEVAKLPEYGQ